jgi:hypothetical protein
MHYLTMTDRAVYAIDPATSRKRKVLAIIQINSDGTAEVEQFDGPRFIAKEFMLATHRGVRRPNYLRRKS